MNLTKLSLLVLICALFCLPPATFAQTQWQVEQTLVLDSEPVDMLISKERRLVYILNGQGEILIYGFNGLLKGQIQAGSSVCKIEAGPGENTLFLLNAKSRSLQMISIHLTEKIDIQGAPYRGRADAAKTIAVFSDFQ